MDDIISSFNDLQKAALKRFFKYFQNETKLFMMSKNFFINNLTRAYKCNNFDLDCLFEGIDDPNRENNNNIDRDNYENHQQINYKPDKINKDKNLKTLLNNSNVNDHNYDNIYKDRIEKMNIVEDKLQRQQSTYTISLHNMNSNNNESDSKSNKSNTSKKSNTSDKRNNILDKYNYVEQRLTKSTDNLVQNINSKDKSSLNETKREFSTNNTQLTNTSNINLRTLDKFKDDNLNKEFDQVLQSISYNNIQSPDKSQQIKKNAKYSHVKSKYMLS